MSETKELTTATVDRKDNHQLTKLFNLSPRNLTEAVEYSKLMAATNLVPKDFIGKPQTILIAVQMGMELGLSPLHAVNSIAVINGRATMWGDAVLALIVKADVLDMDFGTGGYIERPPDEAAKLKEGRFEIKRKGWKETLVRKFTLDDANKAGLVQRSGSSGPWATYTGRMLQMRARSWGLRDACPDVLKGLRVREEEMDHDAMLKDASTGEIVREPLQMPRRKTIEAETVKPGATDTFLKSGPVRPESGQPLEPSKFPPAETSAPVESSTWRGTISEVKSQKTSKNPIYFVTGKDGQKFQTFSKSFADVAFEAKGTGEEVSLTFKTSSYGKDIVSLVRASDVDRDRDEAGSLESE